jgi:type I restriction enzyme S subunit
MLKKKLPLGEISYAESSNVSQQSLTLMPDGDYPVFGAEGFIKKIQKFEQKEAYIAIIKDGSGVGRTALLPPESTVIGTLNYIKPKEGIDLNYLYQAFKSLNFKKYIVGSGIPHIYFNDYKVMEVPVPDYANQKKLGSFLRAIDRLIEKQNEKFELLKKIKKSFLGRMFASSQENIPNLRFDGFGKSWISIQLGEMSDIMAGGTPSTTNDYYWFPKEIPWLSSGEVNKKRIFSSENMISKEGMNNSSARWIKEKSVLIALAGQGKTRGTVAINYFPTTTNQSIAGIIVKSKLNFEFLFQNLEGRYEELRAISSSDGGRGGLNKQLLSKISIPLPTIQEQEKIGSFLSAIDRLIEKEEAAIERYESLKKGYLQKIFAD